MPQPIETGIDQGDKLQHLLAYTVLTCWWMQLFTRTGHRLVIVAVALGLGVGLEFVQGWTGYRTFSYGDMVGDGTGIAFGWLIAPPRLPSVYRVIARWGRSASS
jgi:VanZ family protein